MRTPGRSVFTTNGSGPVPPAWNITGMIPIASYQDARLESYVAETSSTSPRLTPTRQSAGVASIATSHDTAPAGSKYFALERNSRTRLPPRSSVRSVHRPPGCRCPAVPTSTPSSRHHVAVARIRPRPPLLGLARVRVAAVAAAGAAVDVEHRVRLDAHDVQPHRPDLLHPGRLRRRVGDELELVVDVDVGRCRREVVDHVVHHPRVARPVAPAVARGRLHRGLLLAGRERRLAVVDPHAVVQVDHVHARDAAVGVREVRLEAGDPAVDLRALVVELEDDVVAPGPDVDRPEPVLQRLRLRRRREQREEKQAGESEATHRHSVFVGRGRLRHSGRTSTAAGWGSGEVARRRSSAGRCRVNRLYELTRQSLAAASLPSRG